LYSVWWRRSDSRSQVQHAEQIIASARPAIAPSASWPRPFPAPWSSYATRAGMRQLRLLSEDKRSLRPSAACMASQRPSKQDGLPHLAAPSREMVYASRHCQACCWGIRGLCYSRPARHQSGRNSETTYRDPLAESHPTTLSQRSQLAARRASIGRLKKAPSPASGDISASLTAGMSSPPGCFASISTGCPNRSPILSEVPERGPPTRQADGLTLPSLNLASQSSLRRRVPPNGLSQPRRRRRRQSAPRR